MSLGRAFLIEYPVYCSISTDSLAIDMLIFPMIFAQYANSTRSVARAFSFIFSLFRNNFAVYFTDFTDSVAHFTLFQISRLFSILDWILVSFFDSRALNISFLMFNSLELVKKKKEKLFCVLTKRYTPITHRVHTPNPWNVNSTIQVLNLLILLFSIV